MKHLFYILLAALMLVSCEKEPVTVTKGKLDPNAMITLRYAKGDKQAVSSMQKAFVYDQTALEIVENAVNIKWTSHWFDNRNYEDEPQTISRGFLEEHKDYETPALLMWGTDIITQWGEFYKDFIYGFDVYITTYGGDSIAYVPDSVINNARVHIEAAFNDSNYIEVYRLFNEAFTFLPLVEEVE